MPEQKPFDFPLDFPVPLENLQNEVNRKLNPIPAGAASPSVLRAMETLRKVYPADMTGVRVKENSWTDPEAFSNVSGSVPIYGADNTITVNPNHGVIREQDTTEGTLAHELEHIRQRRVQPAVDALREFSLPYSDRPSEKAAWDAKDRYQDVDKPKVIPRPAESGATQMEQFLAHRHLENAIWPYVEDLFIRYPSKQ